MTLAPKSFWKDFFVMKIARRAPLLIMCAAATLAFAQGQPRAVQGGDRLARPVLVISPKFPDATPADMLPVEIRITGTVNEAGVLTSPTYFPGEGKEKFIHAIEEVLPKWRFKPAVDEESCRTVSSVGALSVWFEEKAGRPIVSVSMPLKSKSENGLEQIADQNRFVRTPTFANNRGQTTNIFRNSSIQAPPRSKVPGTPRQCLSLSTATVKGDPVVGT